MNAIVIGDNYNSTGSYYYPPSQGFDWFYAEWADLGWANPQRTVRTEMSIVPSGEAPPGVTSLYVVYASALEISEAIPLNRDLLANGLDYFFGEEGDTPLPPEWLQVNGQTLIDTGQTNEDGTETGATLVAAPAGTETPVSLSLTPDAQLANPDYTFEMCAKPVQLQIMDANTGTNLTTQTNTVIVGQQMNWYVQLSLTNAYATNWPLSDFQWAIPGDAISNYVVASDSSSAVVVTNFPLNSSNVVFYWVDGANNRTIQCSAMIDGKTITGQATFNVLRPIITDFNSGTGVDVHSTNNDGSLSNIDAAVAWATYVQCPAYFSGKVTYAQLIDEFEDYNVSVAGLPVEEGYTTDGQYWLDNNYPYAKDTPQSISWNDVPIKHADHSDDPGLDPTFPFYDHVLVTDNFKTYLQFQPSTAGSIPVTIGRIDWGWVIDAEKTNGVWSASVFTNNPTLDQSDDSFPQWMQVYHNSN